MTDAELAAEAKRLKALGFSRAGVVNPFLDAVIERFDKPATTDNAARFTKGQRVRCVNGTMSGDRLSEGLEYTIAEFEAYNDQVRLEGVECPGFFDGSRFVPAPPAERPAASTPPFAVGQMVECVDDSSSCGSLIKGRKYRVLDIGKGDYADEIRISCGSWNQSRFRAVPDESVEKAGTLAGLGSFLKADHSACNHQNGKCDVPHIEKQTRLVSWSSLSEVPLEVLNNGWFKSKGQPVWEKISKIIRDEISIGNMYWTLDELFTKYEYTLIPNPPDGKPVVMPCGRYEAE